MNRLQRRVQDFHEAMDLPVGDYRNPKFCRTELRVRLIKEEFKELRRAIKKGDMVKAIDALCDLQYVINGGAVEWGIDLEPYDDEVHRTNMLKKDGPVRADGKKLKPPGWQPPRIKDVLDAALRR